MSFGGSGGGEEEGAKNCIYFKTVARQRKFLFFVNSIFPRQENKVRKRSIINGKFRFD